MQKVFIDVIIKNTKEGKVIPLSIIWKSGQRYDVDKVLDVRPAPSLKVGGYGMRYKCRINGSETFLWCEDDKWFVEEK